MFFNPGSKCHVDHESQHTNPDNIRKNCRHIHVPADDEDTITNACFRCQRLSSDKKQDDCFEIQTHGIKHFRDYLRKYNPENNLRLACSQSHALDKLLIMHLFHLEIGVKNYCRSN